jgi:hypothetical protein
MNFYENDMLFFLLISFYIPCVRQNIVRNRETAKEEGWSLVGQMARPLTLVERRSAAEFRN